MIYEGRELKVREFVVWRKLANAMPMTGNDPQLHDAVDRGEVIMIESKGVYESEWREMTNQLRALGDENDYIWFGQTFFFSDPQLAACFAAKWGKRPGTSSLA